MLLPMQKKKMNAITFKNGSSFMLYLIGVVTAHAALMSVIVAQSFLNNLSSLY